MAHEAYMKTILFRFVLLFLLVLIATFCATAHCQTALMPMPRQCFNDNLSAGQPLAGGKIFSYQAGTSIQQATFTDATGLSQNTNPVVLDAGGCASIWLTSGQSYRFVAQNAAGAQEWVTDQVSGLATTSAAFAQASTTVSFSATPTFTATAQQQLFKITLTGNVTSSTLTMSGVSAPSIVNFEITQDATGGRTFVWPLNMSGTVQINLAANSTTTESFFWDGTTAFAWNSVQYAGPPTNLTAGPGIGTGPTIAFAAGSTDSFGQINVTTGTGPSGNAQIAAWTPSRSYSFRFCEVSTGTGSGMGGIIFGLYFSGSNFFLYNNSATALAAATGYTFTYHCDLIP